MVDTKKPSDLELSRTNEYLEQMKNQIKFPMLKIFEKIKDFNKHSEFKHHTKIQLLTDKNSEEQNDDEPHFAFIFVFNNQIILTKDTLENKTEIEKGNHIIKMIRYDHICIYKLIVSDTEKNEMFIQFYIDNYSKKEDLKFLFNGYKDSFCIHHFIKKYYILTWQKIFESTILFNFKSLIYNRHFVLLKINNWGKLQERTLLITNKLIFNVKHNLSKDGTQFVLKDVQWADAIKSIRKIGIIEQKEKELKIYNDKIVLQAQLTEILNTTKYMKYKEIRDFSFFSNDERNEFIAIIRKNYYEIKKDYLPVEIIKDEKK